jgi:hypothetical protein
MFQGRIQDFKLGGVHLKKMRRAEGDAKIVGVFRVKNHDFTPKKSWVLDFFNKKTNPGFLFLLKVRSCVFISNFHHSPPPPPKGYTMEFNSRLHLKHYSES